MGQSPDQYQLARRRRDVISTGERAHRRAATRAHAAAVVIVHARHRQIRGTVNIARAHTRVQWEHGILASHCDSERRIALTMREPALEFARPGSELYEMYGRELIDRSALTISTEG